MMNKIIQEINESGFTDSYGHGLNDVFVTDKWRMPKLAVYGKGETPEQKQRREYAEEMDKFHKEESENR